MKREILFLLSFLSFLLLTSWYGRGATVKDLDLTVQPMTPRDRPRSIWLYLAFVAIVFATSCHRQATPSHSYDGTWMMKLGDRVFIVIRLERQQNGSFTGSISSPKSFELPMGKNLRFSHITLPVTEKKISNASANGAALRLTVEDPANPGEPDIFDLTLSGEDRASLQMVGIPVTPLPFTRVPGGDVPHVATDWDPQRAYTVSDQPVASNAEMRQLFDDDQRARQDFTKLSNEQLAAMSKDDAARRQRTRDLLMAGKLHSSADFREAAFVFQHGDKPDDYLLAPTLAMIAVGKGDEGALWIATATLDRYLQSINRPQIYGTQFKNAPHDKMTREPYDQTLIPDLIREELGVPDLAAQREQLKGFEAATPR